jgi:hypothetical protein
MSEQEIQDKIAYLEFVNDQLDSEWRGLDDLLKATGFPQGVESVKDVAQQLIEEGFEG